jgi:hypothetical protein
MAEQRVRVFFGLLLEHTSHAQPMAGTPTDVPVPSKMNLPLMSRVLKACGTN